MQQQEEAKENTEIPSPEDIEYESGSERSTMMPFSEVVDDTWSEVSKRKLSNFGSALQLAGSAVGAASEVYRSCPSEVWREGFESESSQIERGCSNHQGLRSPVKINPGQGQWNATFDDRFSDISENGQNAISERLQRRDRIQDERSKARSSTQQHNGEGRASLPASHVVGALD